jgi:hypothetical protein
VIRNERKRNRSRLQPQAPTQTHKILPREKSWKLETAQQPIYVAPPVTSTLRNTVQPDEIGQRKQENQDVYRRAGAAAEGRNGTSQIGGGQFTEHIGHPLRPEHSPAPVHRRSDIRLGTNREDCSTPSRALGGRYRTTVNRPLVSGVHVAKQTIAQIGQWRSQLILSIVPGL